MTSSNSFLLLYASQTGQAKAIAEEIHDKAPSFGLKARLFCLSLTDKRFSIEKESCVVFIVSTTGDGEPPDSAEKFFRRLNRQTLKSNYLEHLNYALLALGDSNYIKFCLFGRQLERRLKALSARSFYPSGYGDDAYGVETAVDPWIDNLWPVLKKQLGLSNADICNGGDSKELHLLKTNSLSITGIADQMMEKTNLNGTLISISNLSSVLASIDIKKCSVPKLPSPMLSVSFENSMKKLFEPNINLVPCQASPLSKVNLISAKKLTKGENVKTALELSFKFESTCISYAPGDSFGFICPNPEQEVDSLLERLQVLELADSPVQIKLSDLYTNSRKKLPAHIPSLLTLKDIFLHCLEIRSVPKKILLRILAEHATNGKERDSLLFLSSVDGSKFYTDCVRKPSLSILDILLQYPSCCPPVEVLLEYLPGLKPRFYSVSSSPLQDPNVFRITFNVIRLEKEDGRMYPREGVCTGWLNALFLELQKAVEVGEGNLCDELTKLNLNSQQTSVYVYKRLNNYFHFPEKLDNPVIMVGPGTGVAPFIGYLQHREKLKEDSKPSETWLFFGCRWSNQDFLYKSELLRLKEVGVLTHLNVSFSRDTSISAESKYVHESIRQHASAVVEAIKMGAKILVCGDAKHMSHDVQQAFIDAYRTSCGVTEEEAKSFITKLQTDHRYVNDVWT